MKPPTNQSAIDAVCRDLVERTNRHTEALRATIKATRRD